MSTLIALAVLVLIVMAIPANGSWEGPMVLIVLTAIVVCVLLRGRRDTGHRR